jgi:hypothetical protein
MPRLEVGFTSALRRLNMHDDNISLPVCSFCSSLLFRGKKSISLAFPSDLLPTTQPRQPLRSSLLIRREPTAWSALLHRFKALFGLFALFALFARSNNVASAPKGDDAG